ncbi:reverse transcriptase domain-containing protein [Tanacetum coccineum]
MRTRSQSRNSNRQQQEVNPTFVEPFNLVEPIPVVTMDDNRTMAQLLEAPTVGYEDAIVVPEITADNFEVKHGLLTLVQNKQFFGHDKKDPRAHICYFNKITSTMKFPNVPSTSTFHNKFFPPSKTTNLQNEITRFQQRFDETFYEAWDRFNDLLRACPHHGFSELHQLDTFYNALNSNDQDSLNSAAGGNFLDKMPCDCLRIIESKSKVRNSRNKLVVAKVSSSSSTPGFSTDVAKLKDMVKALLLYKKNQNQALTLVKAVEESCVTCRVMRNMQDQNQNLQNQMTNLTDMLSKFVNSNIASTLGSRTLPSNTITNPKWEMKNEVDNGHGLPTNTEVLKTSNRWLSKLTSRLFTPFGDSDFLLRMSIAFLALEDDPTSPEVHDSYYDPEGDILLLESFLNDDPSPPPPNQGNYLPKIQKELKIYEAKTDTSSIDEPPEVELKDLPPHLKYAFLEGDNKLPVIIAKDLSVEEKAALIKVLKSHKRAIAWKLSDIKENPYENVLDPKEVNEKFPLETLNMVTSCSDSSTPWFADYANYHARNFFVKGMSSQQKNKFFKDVKHYFWEGPYLFKNVGSKLRVPSLSDTLGDALWALLIAYPKHHWVLPHTSCCTKWENSLIYKERTKKLHDSKIKNRIFNVGDRVLLFNSRLKIFSGKLKTRWSGPFTITKVFPYGTIKLSQTDGPNFKVNGHRVKHYFRGDLPPKVVQDLHTFSKDE